MGQEHFNKTITHSWQVGAKIMNQSKQVLKKNTAANYQEGRKGEIFFGFTHAKLTLVYLHSL